MKRSYTDEQLQWLKDNYYDATWDEIFVIFPNRKKSFVQGLASQYGLKRFTNNPRIKNVYDIIGERFGKLVVVNYVGYENGRHFYECKCDCGNTKIILRHSLVYNITKSCGCLHKETLIKNNKKDTNKEKHHTRKIYSSMKNSAKQRGIFFNLSYDEVKNIITKPCYYCGIESSNVHKTSTVDDYGVFKYNGIDRVDSDKGYEDGNVVPCCCICNRAKSTLSQDEFYSWVKKVNEVFTLNRICG